MENQRIRKPAAAGQFYPSSANQLRSDIQQLVDKKAEKINALACVLPHAGYIYSGEIAAKTVSQVKIKDKIILLGPNHTGLGSPFSIMAEGRWETPLGEVKIDGPLAGKLLSSSRYWKDEPLAHLYEHCLEVELPFLQYFSNTFQIVPLVIMPDELNTLKDAGGEIARLIKENGLLDSTLLVASSDMTHYEPQAQAEKKDRQAIEAVLELNADKLMAKVKDLDISMCGYAPTIVMLSAAKILGATGARLIKYATSGDVTGDKGSVVGYAGIIIY